MIRILLFLLCTLYFNNLYARDHLMDAMDISSSGIAAQNKRLRVISENIANIDSTATEPGGEPYRRKTITFANRKDKKKNDIRVVVKNIGKDTKTPFEMRYEPGHPAANEQGYVLYPNVSLPIEMSDMREAQNSYEANLNSLDITKSTIIRTIDLLK